MILKQYIWGHRRVYEVQKQNIQSDQLKQNIKTYKMLLECILQKLTVHYPPETVYTLNLLGMEADWTIIPVTVLLHNRK